MSRFFRLAVLLILLAGLLPACLPQADISTADLTGWVYVDLCALKKYQAVNRSTDLVALYIRSRGSQVQIRLDFLDLQAEDQLDIYVNLDIDRDGNPASQLLPEEARRQWKYQLVVPAEGEPYALDTSRKRVKGMLVRASRDDLLDEVVLTLRRRDLPRDLSQITILAYSFLLGSNDTGISIGPNSLGGSQPGQAKLLLAFWNTLTADTPAQALRGWDGAHAGPLGQRHGLRMLLQAAEKYRIPLALLDLKKPRNLAALDLVGGSAWVKTLAEKGLLLLPDNAWGDPYLTVGLQSSRRAADAFGFEASPWLFGALRTAVPAGYSWAFAVLPQVRQVVQWGSLRLVPLPEGFLELESAPALDEQPSRDGPSLSLRFALLENAHLPEPNAFVVEGGDLTRSTWGDSAAAENTLCYLVNHPWVKVLSEADLAVLQTCSGSDCYPAAEAPCADWLCLPAEEGLEPLRALLDSSPPGVITDLAWDAYLYLTDPLASMELQALRRAYLGQVRLLVKAAHWADHPYPRADCSVDLDGDGAPECVLANDRVFAVIEPLGARLVLGVYRTAQGTVQQFTGTSAPFAVGLSDASTWQLLAGEQADPAVLPGAFADTPGTWNPYQPLTSENTIEFTALSGGIRKTFRIDEQSIKVEYSGVERVKVSVPLVVGSDWRFSPGWAQDYRLEKGENLAGWGTREGFTVEGTASVPLASQAFTDSSPWMAQGENPDRSYPAGHYLPLPLALVELTGSGNFTITLRYK
jgi:hypothetical protein